MDVKTRDTRHVDDLGGQNLRHRRESAGYFDREEFARLVGISPRTLEGWESRSGHVPEWKVDLVEEVLARPATPSPLSDQSTAELTAQLLRIAAELNARLSQPKPTPRGEIYPTRPEDAENAPTDETHANVSHTVHPKQPSRQVGKRPPRPTPGPTPK